MKIESQDDIIRMIKHYMIDYNIRQKDIVEKSGLKRSTISNLLAGRSNMQINTLLSLLDNVDAELCVEIRHKKSDSDSMDMDSMKSCYDKIDKKLDDINDNSKINSSDCDALI